MIEEMIEWLIGTLAAEEDIIKQPHQPRQFAASVTGRNTPVHPGKSITTTVSLKFHVSIFFLSKFRYFFFNFYGN